MSHPRVIPVRLGQRSYAVHVGAGLLGDVGALAGRVCPTSSRRACLVCDASLPSALLAEALASLGRSHWTVTTVTIKANEGHKTLDGLSGILTALAGSRHERGDPVIALGGGIVGDMAGFAGAIYRRGVPVIQCPTTLLAMVDASVGGKTGVNLETHDATGRASLKKNMIGAFHQPVAVVADVQSLNSLPDRILRSGLAECIKHGMLSADWGDEKLLDFTQANMDAIVGRDLEILTELIARNVAVKAAVVAADERESAAGPRATLNLGHTFAHAIETLPGVSPAGLPADAGLQHGEAVAMGLAASARLSAAMSSLDGASAEALIAMIERAGLPTRAVGLPSADEILERMRHDKKALGGVIRVVLPVHGRRANVVELADTSRLVEILASLRGLD